MLTPITENNVGNLPNNTKSQDDADKTSHAPSIVDMLSRTKTKDEIMNQKKARAQSIAKAKSSEPERPVAESIQKSVEKPAEKPAEKPVEKPVAKPAEVPVAKAVETPRGRDPSESATTTTAKPASEKPASTKPRHPDDDRPSMALAPKSTRIQERDLSPGTLPDGSHVKCSGEKGESYTPPTGLGGKLGGKLRGLGH